MGFECCNGLRHMVLCLACLPLILPDDVCNNHQIQRPRELFLEQNITTLSIGS